MDRILSLGCAILCCAVLCLKYIKAVRGYTMMLVIVSQHSCVHCCYLGSQSGTMLIASCYRFFAVNPAVYPYKLPAVPSCSISSMTGLQAVV